MPNIPDDFVWATFKLGAAGDGDAVWCLGWQLTWCGVSVDETFSEARHVPREWVHDGTIKLCDGCMAAFVANKLVPGHVNRIDDDRDIPTTAREIMEDS